jgi:pantoate--beta-alanine ligase
MQIIKDIEEFRLYRKALYKEGVSVGLVPTMGALHEGHLQLVKEASEACDMLVVTIFVNPTQFNKKEDLDKYPRTLEKDLDMLSNLSVDVVFAPETHEIYPADPTIEFGLGEIASRLEGEFRPGHFNGVALIVAKLFNIIQPDVAFFGQKDLQQLQIIRQMVHELSYPIKIVAATTVRDKHGLALSSRNQRLTSHGLEIARKINVGLEKGKELLEKRENRNVILQALRDRYQSIDGLTLEYLEVVDPEVMQPVENYNHLLNVAICVAAYVEDIRLIDNVVVSLD